MAPNPYNKVSRVPPGTRLQGLCCLLQVGKFSMMANSRARAQDDAEGIVKFIADAGV